jgi:hypothetical protein
MFDNLSFGLLGLNFAQTEIDEILVPWVVEIAKEVSLYSEVPVVECSLSCSLSSRSKISLHGRSSGVEDADCICIFGPLDSEDLLESIWKFLEGWCASPFVDHVEFSEPPQQELSGKDWLDDVCSI